MKMTIENLEFDLRKERAWAKKEITKRNVIIEEMQEKFDKERASLINWQQLEGKVHSAIQN